MKWTCISGSWRFINRQIAKDVRIAVGQIILAGNGIITGGALGVDYVALDEALKHNPSATQIKVYLPTSLEIYQKHYLQRANEGVITLQQAKKLIKQLTLLKIINPLALIENLENSVVEQKTYYQRISQEIANADSLIAFWVNQTTGTKDSIDKAKKKGLPIKVFSYTI